MSTVVPLSRDRASSSRASRSRDVARALDLGSSPERSRSLERAGRDARDVRDLSRARRDVRCDVRIVSNDRRDRGDEETR